MNVIKKYWDFVYIYVLLLVPGFCICAGIFWTVCKYMGMYSDLEWTKIIIFDGSQLIYFAVALYFIYQNKKDSSYIPQHLNYIKGYIILVLFVQYNFILYLFPSVHVWECTFLFFAIIVFLFDSKLMFLNIMSYFIFLLVAHILRPEKFLPLEAENLKEIIAFRIVIFVLTALCIMIIVYFVERFLIQAQESNEENMHLVEKQLQYYRDMDLLDKELRKFRHDMKNHFICMESILNSGKPEDMKEYFQQWQQSFSFEKKMYFSGNEIIDTILHHDLPHCSEKVKISVFGSLPPIETVSAMDLCTLFSNLLSNAVASANQCAGLEEPQIIIRFSGGSRYFSIDISNSILARKDVKQRRKRDRNHGFGIHKMKSVLEKYDGRYELSVEQQMLHVMIYLPI